MPQSAGGGGNAPTGGGGARSRVKQGAPAEAQPIKPSSDGQASNNYGINGANGEQQVRRVNGYCMLTQNSTYSI